MERNKRNKWIGGVFLFSILLFTGFTGCGKLGGKSVSETIKEVEKNPNKYLGKEIIVTGIVVGVADNRLLKKTIPGLNQPDVKMKIIDKKNVEKFMKNPFIEVPMIEINFWHYKGKVPRSPKKITVKGILRKEFGRYYVVDVK